MFYNDSSISWQIGSSQHSARTDDAVKDEDNVAWVLDLPEAERLEWVTALKWIRLPDRMLEHDVFDSPTKASATFAQFSTAYFQVRETGDLSGSGPFYSLLAALRTRWQREALSEADLQVWDLYLFSLERYAHPDFRIADMREYGEALYGLSGTFFQTLPFMPTAYRAQVGVLGTLDQFYNNLRDLEEDTARGLCYFPDDLLNRFQLQRGDMPQLIESPTPRFVALIEWLCHCFAADLRRQLGPLLTAPDLHPSWEIMLRSVLLRHHRIDYWFRACGYSAARFSRTYWNQVDADLALRRPRTRELPVQELLIQLA